MTRDEQIAALAAKWEAEAAEMDAMQARNFNPHTASRIDEMHEKADDLRALLASPAAPAETAPESDRPLSDEDLDRLRAFVGAASPLPWVSTKEASEREHFTDSIYSDAGRDEGLLVGRVNQSGQHRIDTALLVSAVNLAPALIAEIDRLRAALSSASATEAALRGERDEACEALREALAVVEAARPVLRRSSLRPADADARWDAMQGRWRSVLARIRKETPDHE